MSALRWAFEAIKASLFEQKVCLDITVRCRRAFVTEPEGDDFKGNSRLEKVHRGGVTERMRCDVLGAKGGASGRGDLHCGFEPKGDAFARQRFAAVVGEDQLIWGDSVRLNPLPELSGGSVPERHGAFLAAFAVEQNGPCLMISGPKLEHLRNSRAGVIEEAKEQSVAASRPSLGRNGIENRGHL